VTVKYDANEGADGRIEQGWERFPKRESETGVGYMLDCRDRMLGRALANTLRLGTIRGNRSLALPPLGRSTHLYICGGSGVGKSKLLEHLIRQDIKAWTDSHSGLLLLDPHGSVYHNLVDWMAANGTAALKRPVVLVDLAQDQSIVAYNVLRRRDRASRSVVIDALVEAIAHVWGAANTTATPLFARWASNLLTLLYENKLTLAEAAALLDDFPLRNSLAEALEDGGMARRDWAVADRLNAKDFEAQVSSTVNRLRAFLENDLLRTMFGQTQPSFDFRRAMDEGWIVLVNLSQEGAKVSAADTALFGRLLLSDLWTAAKERGKPRDAKQVRPFYVYVDEFQTFVTPTLADSLDQARGFGLHLTMSHQYPSQLSDQGPDGKRVLNSIMANAASKVAFRTEIPTDLAPLAQWLFMGTMDPEKIKLKMYSTKVMGYREEERQTTTETHSSTRGSGHSQGSNSGTGASRPIDPPPALEYEPGSQSEQESQSSSANEFSTEGESSSVATSTVLIPEIGKELTHVQFASLDEQLFEAMQSLFSQDQQECTARLAGMKAPVSLRTFPVEPARPRPAQIDRFISACQSRWPFVLPAAEARQRLAARKTVLNTEVKNASADDEPTSAKATAKRTRK
jgi:hypothetical protein